MDVISMVWEINEKEDFAINENLDIQIKELAGNKIVIVDNFYKNPDTIRKIILNSPASSSGKFTGYYPDLRQYMNFDLASFKSSVSDISEKVFDVILLDEIQFISNIFQDYGKDPGAYSAPHADPNYFSGIIYLNSPEECVGGTAFYRNKKTNKEYSLNSIDDKPVFKNEFLTKSDENWEFLDMAEMKYNRFVMYRGNIFHNAYIEKGWFQNYPRIVQAYFYHNVINKESVLRMNTGVQVHFNNNDYNAVLILPGGRIINIGRPFADFLLLNDGKKTFQEILDSLPEKYQFKGKNYPLLRDILGSFFRDKILFTT